MVIEDQKIPMALNKENDGTSSFYYVNSNGFAVQSQVANSPPKKTSNNLTDSKNVSKSTTNNPLICTDLIIDMCKNEKKQANCKPLNSNCLDAQSTDSLKSSSTYSLDQKLETRSVPSQSDDASSNEFASNNSLVQRDANGKYLINTSLVIQEPTVDINNDHIKYLNLFSILCCWCFPITGIISIVFSRTARKHFDRRDMVKAKEYLVKSEWMLIITIFFGCTIIGLVFGFLESFVFKNERGELIQPGVYQRSFPK